MELVHFNQSVSVAIETTFPYTERLPRNYSPDRFRMGKCFGKLIYLISSPKAASASVSAAYELQTHTVHLSTYLSILQGTSATA